MTVIICQAVGCTHTRRRSQFMCTPHWKALPGQLRAQINATWRAWRARTGDGQDLWLEYIVACDEAQRWTAEGEGRIGQFEPHAPRLRKLRGMREERTPEAVLPHPDRPQFPGKMCFVYCGDDACNCGVREAQQAAVARGQA